MYKKYGKRLLDLCIVAGAVVTLIPVIIIVYFLIKVFDPGPVIFRQQRVGLNGKLFNFYKFRSMPVNTGDIPSDQLGNIKLSWVGRVIRRTNIDELPQLFNVIKGDMSIVGPRPALPTQVELINLRSGNGATKCRPGLTGLAQVSSFDGMSAAHKAGLDG